jgi:LysR substrate binding domain
VWRLADLGAKHALLLAGVGWGNMPEPHVRADLAAGRLVRLELPEARNALYPLRVLHRTDEPPGPAAAWCSTVGLRRLRKADCPARAHTRERLKIHYFLSIRVTPASTDPRRLLRPAASHHGNRRFQENIKVQPNGPVQDVEQILRPLNAEVSRAARADLP